MSYALLFSGQAGQHADMLPWLEDAPLARQALEVMAGVVGADWREQLRDGGCRTSNAFAQPVIVGTAVAAWEALRPLLGSCPEVVAGYSVGEVAALGAAEAIDPAQAIALAARRAVLMDGAVAGVDTGLVAITALGESEVLSSCPGLECAIRIAVDHNVYGGAGIALARARLSLAERANVKPLCVALASHTSWMRPALRDFEQAVREAGLRPPACPLALDAMGATSRDAAVLASAVAAQLAQCVEWRSCMAAVAERRPSCVLEVGGGQALSRMWSAQFPHIPARSLDEFRSPEGAAAWIARHS